MAVTTETLARELLAEHPNLDARDIEVRVDGTRASLRGKVRTQRERDEVEATIRGLRGVDQVENRLVVTGEPI